MLRPKGGRDFGEKLRRTNGENVFVGWFAAVKIWGYNEIKRLYLL
jgi:hypothetical protein